MPLSTACSVVLFVGGAQKPFFVSPQADIFDLFGGFCGCDVFVLFPLCFWVGGWGRLIFFFEKPLFSFFFFRCFWAG